MNHIARETNRPVAAASSNATDAAARVELPRDAPSSRRPIRMLRLPQVIDATGLGKTKIYELQGQGDFPMRVKITAHSVAWVEEEIQAWLSARIQANSSPTTINHFLSGTKR
jgi:prophage regulatory protein